MCPDISDWGEIFNDQVLATAILDRLLHQSATINIKGDRFRLKEKRKAGLLGRTSVIPDGLPTKTEMPDYESGGERRP